MWWGKRLKINFLCAEVSQSGGDRVTSIYAQKLIDLGHDVTVIARRPQKVARWRRAWRALKGKPERILADRDRYFRGLGERFHWLDHKVPLDPDDLPEADILIATWWRTAFEAAIMPPEKGRKVYFVQHHEVHDHLPHDLSAGSYWLPLKKITIADWLVETMANIYDDHDVAMVPNSVDTAQFNAPPRERNSRPRVGFLYAPATFKGLDISLRAIQIARAHYPDLEVTAFGTRDPIDRFPLPVGIDS
jgi:glycosyltransferase involved in cell wall biosynthesis